MVLTEIPTKIDVSENDFPINDLIRNVKNEANSWFQI